MTTARRMTRADASASRKEVEVGGFSFLLRKLTADEFVSLGIIPSGVVAGTVTTEAEALDAAFGPDLSARVNGMIAAAVLEPQIWIGTLASCPPDELWVGDLGDVRDELVAAIYEHSKLPEDLAKALRFRDHRRLGGDALEPVDGGGDAPVGSAPAEDPAGAPA
jgi:hypothetical protein